MNDIPCATGGVDAVLADLHKAYATSPPTIGDGWKDCLVYAAAIGMITGITGSFDGRSAQARMADIATVCAAVRRFADEGPNR